MTARFSGQGWMLLRTLPRLRHICTPYGLTDEEMAGLATLQTVDEMEIVADRLTDAGLASLAKLRNLQVLHLEGTPMMTDEGLRVLATLPKLRHLRLSGPFTDRGLAYLAGRELGVMCLINGEGDRNPGRTTAPAPAFRPSASDQFSRP